jgi:hypothetical protein
MSFDMLRILENPFELVKFRYLKMIGKVMFLTLSQVIVIFSLSEQDHSVEYKGIEYCFEMS